MQMDTGFKQRYRIETEVPRPGHYLKLNAVKALLQAAQWGEARNVVEVDDNTYGVRFEATGIASQRHLRQVVYGDQFEDVTASLTVTESGHLSHVTFDITATKNGDEIQETATIEVENLGETTVKAPQWVETARQKGYQFTAQPTDNQKAIKLEMTNGEPLPSGTRVSLSSPGYDSKPLEQEVTVGDSLYLSFSPDGDLLIDFDGVPDDATTLTDHTFVSLRYRQFLLFDHQLRL
ncbi:hypothetical protein DMJ13_10825 [halophilic archaeon]|nr:hypothetical protein DMJ13_10825 [halophilic archaeon]